MKRVISAFLAAALAAGSVPFLASGSGPAVGCCDAKSCCEAGPPCAAGASACAASKSPDGSSGCILRARPCDAPFARVTVAAVDPMLRPGPVMGIDAPGPAETVPAFDRHARRRATEPSVPPPRA